MTEELNEIHDRIQDRNQVRQEKCMLILFFASYALCIYDFYLLSLTDIHSVRTWIIINSISYFLLLPYLAFYHICPAIFNSCMTHFYHYLLMSTVIWTTLWTTTGFIVWIQYVTNMVSFLQSYLFLKLASQFFVTGMCVIKYDRLQWDQPPFTDAVASGDGGEGNPDPVLPD
jgi:hypothetical protein